MVLYIRNWPRSVTSALTLTCLLLIFLQEGKEVSASVRFFKDTWFNGGLLYESHAKMEDGCVNLPSSADNQISSLNTGCLCVDLFDGKDCKGQTIKTYPGTPYHDQLNLLHFDNKISSFRICSEFPKPPPNTQVALYRHSCYMDLLVDYKEVCKCTNVPLNAMNRISSVNPNVNCIRFYTAQNCMGQMKEIRANEIGHYDFADISFNDVTESVGPCDDDDESYQNCSRLIPKPLLLNGKVFKVEYHAPQLTGSDSSHRFNTKDIETGRLQVFKNDAPHIKMQEYADQFTAGDFYERSIPVAAFRQLKTLTEVDDVSYHRIHSQVDRNVADVEPLSSFAENKTIKEIKKESSNNNVIKTEEIYFHKTKNSLASEEMTANHSYAYGNFAETESLPSSDVRNEESENVISTKEIYFSRDSLAHKEVNEDDKYISKMEAMRIVKENLDKEIVANLKTDYWQMVKESVASNPENIDHSVPAVQIRSKEFVINKTVAIPPCTEYEMKSFLKRTARFPVEFSTYLEITGTDEDENSNSGKGTTTSAREIVEKLKELEGFQYVETKDNETVVVAINGGEILMDFSWYAVWEGAWKASDGCNVECKPGTPHHQDVGHHDYEDLTK